MGSAMLKPAKSLISNKYLTVKKGFSYLTKFKQKSVLLLLFFSFGVGEEGGGGWQGTQSAELHKTYLIQKSCHRNTSFTFFLFFVKINDMIKMSVSKFKHLMND